LVHALEKAPISSGNPPNFPGELVDSSEELTNSLFGSRISGKKACIFLFRPCGSSAEIRILRGETYERRRKIGSFFFAPSQLRADARRLELMLTHSVNA